MNPGLVIKLRPNGPWRIGPDSGARNRVDAIYHSDSLYSAVTSAMARLAWLDEWIEATARKTPAAVCFSSCFPFLEEIGFIVPPRTIWPPTSPGMMSARVRWKSARFIPLGIVQAMLAGQRLDENHWSVDGASECLVPAGRPGPFRSGLRWSAAVDRLTGATERHSTACIEFRAGCGLWTVASFLDEAARDSWLERVKAAFRLLADTGLGGERSRGWGRSDPPEFIDGVLPDMIVGEPRGHAGYPGGVGVGEEPPAEPEPVPEPSEAEAAVLAPPAIEPLAADLSELLPESEPELAAPESEPPLADPDPPGDDAVPPTPEPEAEATAAPAEEAPSTAAPGTEPLTAAPEPPATQAPEPSAAPAPELTLIPIPEHGAELTPAPEPPTTPAIEPVPESAAIPAPEESPAPEPPTTPAIEPAPEAAAIPAPEESPAPEPPTTSAIEPAPEAAVTPTPEVRPPAPEPPTTPPIEPAPESAVTPTPSPQPPTPEVPAPGPRPPAPEKAPAPEKLPAFWLLSLFTPAPGDSIDWRRGNYSVLARGGRVDSPAGSGELKKQIQMVAEGSVLHAASEPRGSAADVAPDGFPHPVFRAGFAVSVRLPEVS